MIDGIQLTYHAPEDTHLLGLTIWEVLVNEKTGFRVNDVRTAKLRGLDLKLKPSSKGGYLFLINGSIHKYFNCEEHNYDQFTYENLLQAIGSLISTFCIEAEKCEIHGLEIGVNIALRHAPLRAIKELVCYGAKPFTQISKKRAKMGLKCALPQYTLKIYDKGAQGFTEAGNVLRVEVAIEKMQVVDKYKLVTLADLFDREKAFSLIGILLGAVNGIVWTDNTVSLKRLNNREQKQWLAFSNPKFWQECGKHKRMRAKRAWATLLSKYGSPTKLPTEIKRVWALLFESTEAVIRQPSYTAPHPNEADTETTLLPLECTVGKYAILPANYDAKPANYSISKTLNTNSGNPIRKCASCGKDIRIQRRGSRFCSETYFGREAKCCRNRSSNLRRNKRLLIRKAQEQGCELLVVYADAPKNKIIAHPGRVSLDAPHIDKILFVKKIKKNATVIA